jgi:alcohol dehydrogenase, propanol-preferring
MSLVRSAVLPSPRKELQIRELAVEAPGPGELVVKLEACGICHSDLMISQLEALPLSPLIVGHEGVGRVEQAGEGVTHVKAGDRVGVTYLATTCGTCELCTTGLERYCAKQTQHGYTRHGAMAERALVAAQHTIKIPEGLPAEKAAPLCCAGWTAYGAVRGAGLRAGQRIALFGMGGLGHLAVQYARHLGLEVVAADVVEAKLEQARALGASLAVHAADAGKAILKACGGVDAAVCFTPSPQAIHEAARALKRTGTLQLVGMGATTRFDLALNELVLKGHTVRGSFLGTRADLEEVLRLATQGIGLPHVETHPIEEAAALFHKVRAGEVLGRAVIVFA